MERPLAPESTPPITSKLPATRLVWRHGAETLVLKPQTVQAAPAVHAAVVESLPEIKRHLPWAHAPYDLASAIERAKDASTLYWQGRDAIFGLWRGERPEDLIGCFGLHPRTLSELGREVGYWVRTRDAGRGYATAAVKALIVYAFDHLGLTRFQLCHNELNRASQRVREKCGFREEGRLRNFEPPPTPALVEGGLVAGPVCVVTGLVPEDLPGLPWVPAMRAALEVYDWQGQRAAPWWVP